jgi:hypothetical protein
MYHPGSAGSGSDVTMVVVVTVDVVVVPATVVVAIVVVAIVVVGVLTTTESGSAVREPNVFDWRSKDPLCTKFCTVLVSIGFLIRKFITMLPGEIESISMSSGDTPSESAR